MGGTQILNTGSDWTAGSPMPPGRFMPSPSFQDGPQPVPGQPPRQFIPDPNLPYAQTGADPNAPFPDPSTWMHTTGSGQPINQPMGSLQSLGGGQLNQSGMVTLRAPDGSQTKAVPADQVAHWLSRGAVRV
jgi:hypothetical protein